MLGMMLDQMTKKDLRKIFRFVANIANRLMDSAEKKLEVT